MFLTNSDVTELIDFRRGLHRKPEISGEEEQTAATVVEALKLTGPDEIITGLGGHGVVAIYDSGVAGPTVMFRCELDALPIDELSDIAHRSEIPGKAHLCGHDGHTAILAGLARGLGRQRTDRGRVALLFQPAEETGAGAAAVIADPRFASVAPDYAFSLHNMPGFALGDAWLREGPVNCASRGLKVSLSGKTAHASAPETGVSPMIAVAALMPALTALGPGGELDANFRLVTVTHSRMGEAAFGIAPGYAEIWATLRTLTDDQMQNLCQGAEALAREAADISGLVLEMSYHDVFHHCENNPDAVAILRDALDQTGTRHTEGPILRASEDFGLFGHKAKSAMFFLGSGKDIAHLHNPDFDFPDALIEPGARIFMRVARNLLG